jgi:arylsulfatase A-like enzyme
MRPPGSPTSSVNRPYHGIVTRDGWKYVSFEGVPWLLYNLNEDPYEQVNQAHNNACRAELKRLQARLQQRVADTGDKF